jgi:hypothetical protein
LKTERKKIANVIKEQDLRAAKFVDKIERRRGRAQADRGCLLRGA